MGNLIPTLPGCINNLYGPDALPSRVLLYKPGYITGNPVKPPLKPPVIRVKGINGPVCVFADTPEAGDRGDGGDRDIAGI
jgi:hypothetical protein